MKDSSLGSFLQQLRKENQLTQKELASQLHVTDKAVSKWERDLSAPAALTAACPSSCPI